MPEVSVTVSYDRGDGWGCGAFEVWRGEAEPARLAAAVALASRAAASRVAEGCRSAGVRIEAVGAGA